MDLTKIDNDFSEEEVETINTFVENGCIGLATLAKEEHKINNMFGLYMGGKTYIEISKVTKTKKNLVLYMAAKMGWYEKRITYIDEIQKSMTTKIKDIKVKSLNFTADLIEFHHKFYGDRIAQYMATGDRTVIDGLDLKSLNMYFKAIENLEKILNPTNVTRGGGSGATININAAGADVSMSDDTVEITPGNQGDILKALAKMKDDKKKEDK